jgi:hypothetical protein
MREPPGPVSTDGLTANKPLPDQARREATPQDELLQTIKQNLAGDGAAVRWRDTLRKLIRSQSAFTYMSVKLEKTVDTLTPLAILGVEGLKQAYHTLNAALGPNEQWPAPDEAELLAAGRTFLQTLRKIQKHGIVGEPSPQHNLDTLVLADITRLGELLDSFEAELKEELQPGDSDAAKLEKARAHSTEEGTLLRFARRYANVQFEALINKLSRAYQKPDYCVRRDSFTAADRDRLLPQSLSWNEDWYYGEKIVLSKDLALEILKLNASEEADVP